MFTLLMTVVLLHPVHETQSEIEWNEESRRLEVALRLDVLDEQWLARHVALNDANTRREGSAEAIPEWARDYLRRRFRVTSAVKPDQADTATYHWVGRKHEGSHVWWFFEIEPRSEQRPEWVEVKLLREHPEAYSHRILLLGLSPKPAMTLTDQQPRKRLPWTNEDAAGKNRGTAEVRDGN